MLLLLLFSTFITDPVQNYIFIFSWQNYVSITLTYRNYHEVYAVIGLKFFFIYDDALGL